MKRMFVFTIFVIFTQSAFALDCGEPTTDGCPAGCELSTYNECIECPLGTYSTGGYDGVEFCDSIGCFYLPSGVVIPYNPD